MVRRRKTKVKVITIIPPRKKTTKQEIRKTLSTRIEKTAMKVLKSPFASPIEKERARRILRNGK